MLSRVFCRVAGGASTGAMSPAEFASPVCFAKSPVHIEQFAVVTSSFRPIRHLVG